MPLMLGLAGVLQIKIALKVAKDLIVNAPFVAKAKESAALHAQEFVRERSVLVVVQGLRGCTIELARESVQLFAIVLREVIIHTGKLGTVVAASFFEMRKCGINGDSMCLLLLALRSYSTCQAEAADQGRQT